MAHLLGQGAVVIGVDIFGLQAAGAIYPGTEYDLERAGAVRIHFARDLLLPLSSTPSCTPE